MLGRLAEAAPSSQDLAQQVAGIATAKFDSLVPQTVLRTFWAKANTAVVALLPEVAAALLAMARRAPRQSSIATGDGP
jgi:hypothetical protein